MLKVFFILLFCASSAFGAQAFVRLHVEKELHFYCTIPDHGGGCSSETAVVMYSAPVKGLVQITNLSLNETESRRVLDLSDVLPSEDRPISVELIRDKKLEDRSVVLREGNNKLRVELLSIDGGLIAAMEVDVDTTYEDSF
ncbi:MAG: hypothetical protein HY537_07060 [Deltaproteobacteria bacterium]|nr:hypothetical protein [Deltaproteobacteria bacterium]